MRDVLYEGCSLWSLYLPSRKMTALSYSCSNYFNIIIYLEKLSKKKLKVGMLDISNSSQHPPPLSN